jgi:glycine/serine hydroxymethyltransferase
MNVRHRVPLSPTSTPKAIRVSAITAAVSSWIPRNNWDHGGHLMHGGIRIGTAAATTRGFGKDDIQRVAHWITDVIDANGAEPVLQRALVLKLCQRYPVYSAPWHNPPGTV